MCQSRCGNLLIDTHFTNDAAVQKKENVAKGKLLGKMRSIRKSGEERKHRPRNASDSKWRIAGVLVGGISRCR